MAEHWRPSRLAYFGIGLVSIAVLCLAAGCRGKTARRQIVGIPKTSVGWLFLVELSGMSEATYKAGLDLYWNGPADADPQRQVELIEDAVKRESYGIAINPVSRFTSNVAIGDAISHGIPVVVMGQTVPIAPAKHLSFVLEDTKSGAELAADRLNTLLHGTGNVAFVGINPRAPETIERAEALTASLGRIAPGIHIITRVISSQGYGYAEGAVSRLLDDNPNLNAIVSMHNRAGLAAAVAMQSFAPRHKVYQIVFDQNLELMSLLREHAIDSIVIQNQRAIGRQAVENIIADRRGQYVKPVTSFKPYLVTPENIDGEDMQQLLLMNWKHP